MVDNKIVDMAFRLYGNNPYTNHTFLGSPKPWSNYQFNEELIGSNVGANTGRGMNSTTSLQGAKLYAGPNGEVLPVNLLDDKYYYDINKPYSKQSGLVQFFIDNPNTNRLNYNQYQQVLDQASPTPIAGLRNTNVPGEVAYVTINPSTNAEIIAPFERGQRQYLSLDKLKQVGDNYQKTKRLMGNYIAPVVNHPITKALGKAASTIMAGANIAGDTMMVGEFINRTSQWHPDNIQWNQSGNPIPTRGVGMVVPASQPQPWEDSPVRLYGGVTYND